MHGITRTRNRDNVEQSKLKAASTLYANKCNQIYSKNVDELSLNDLSDIGEVLSISPENSTLWNLRKRIILRYLNELQQSKSDDLKNDSDQDEERLNIFKNELRFNAVCLSQNPKSYASWFHRKWCLQAMDNATLLEEMDICKEYLSRDERNFHCWAYWYFLTNEINLLTPEQCLAFVTEKLIENFSNYSAWHYRSMLLANNSSLLQFSSAVDKVLGFTIDGS
ncbi:hypothetical protein GJ496_004547 [Pomphorhynchus laevis]|nr:hypothetical protein GJ496_004547 [Pomphorhynchus laevis]